MGKDLAELRVVAAIVLLNLGLASTVGAWASVVWLRRAESGWAADARRRSWTALRQALAVTVVADALLLWLQAAYMGDLPLGAAFLLLPSMLTTTYVGHAWAGGAAGLVLLLWAVSAPATTPHLKGRLAGVGIGMGLFIYCRAAVSHAGNGGLASLQLLVESAHLWAISLWLGGVGIAAFAVLTRPSAATEADRCDAASWVRALSANATGAVAVIVGTGLFTAWRSVGSAANLVGSAYGNTLIAKVALVAAALLLGGVNRFWRMPPLLAALRSPQASFAQRQRRFAQLLCVEAVVLLAALVAAAFLASGALPPAT